METSNFIRIFPVGTQLPQVERRMDGRTGMTKLIVAFAILRTHLNFISKQTENSCRIIFCVLKFSNVIKGQISMSNSQITFHRTALLGTDTTPVSTLTFQQRSQYMDDPGFDR